MNIEVQKDGPSLSVRVMHQRLDGDNLIYNAIKNNDYFSSEIEDVIIDFDSVEYINSLGITELVNIHRKYTDTSYGKVNFKFLNVDKKVNAILELVEIHKIADIEVKK